MERMNLLDVLILDVFPHVFASHFVQKVGAEMQLSQ